MNAETERKKVGLALGGGAGRGFAHIGVLDEFVKAGIPIDCICGCSMGAFIGSIFAAGTDLSMLARLSIELTDKDFFDITLPRSGLIRGERFRQLSRLLTKDKCFEELEIPFSCVACDLSAVKTVVLNQGKVYDAVRASISMPGIFQPHFIDGVLYVDGGVLDVVPIQQTRDMGADYVIAVDVSSPCLPREVKPKVFDILMRAYDMVGYYYKQTKIYAGDILLQPKLDEINPYSNSDAEEAIASGREAARTAIPKILEDLLGLGVIG